MGADVTHGAIRLQGVTLAYDNQVAVEAVSGTFAPGGLTAIVGPNGAGKTTLLRAIAGLHKLAAGRIDRDGLAPSDIGFLPQASRLDRSFPIACLDVVAAGNWGRVGAFRTVTPTMLGAALAALAAVGLADAAKRPVGALSAGQFQRVLFARLIVQDAPVVLLDEPFSAVDARTEADLLRIVQRWHADGRTVIAVLHDLDLVQHAFPETLLLARETIAWGTTAAALSSANRRRVRLGSDAWAVPDKPALTAA